MTTSLRMTYLIKKWPYNKIIIDDSGPTPVPEKVLQD